MTLLSEAIVHDYETSTSGECSTGGGGADDKHVVYFWVAAEIRQTSRMSDMSNMARLSSLYMSYLGIINCATTVYVRPLDHVELKLLCHFFK